MKFNVDNCVEMLRKDLKREVSSFTKKNGRSPDEIECKNLKLLVGFESAERYVTALEESVNHNRAVPADPAVASKVSTIRAQWNLCLNSAARDGITVDENAHHLMNFVDYVNWVSADENAMFKALENFLIN